MALSGRINGTVSLNSSRIGYYINWSAVQNIAGNYSDVTASSYWEKYSNWNFDTVGTRNYWLEINGDKSSGNKRFDLDPFNSPYLIQAKTTRVYHDSDGSKTINIKAFTDGHASSYGTNDSNASANVTLNTIPREAYITSSVDFIIGNSIKVDLNNPAGYSLKFHLYVNGEYICEKIGSGTSSILTFTTAEINAMYSKITTANSCNTFIGVATMNGSTQIGVWKNKEGTCYVSNSNPIINSFTYKDTSTAINITGSNQKLLQNKSQIQITIGDTTLKNHATLKKYSVQIGTRLYESTSKIINIGTTISEENIIVKIIDSRGNSHGISKSIKKQNGNIVLIEYQDPVINKYVAQRISGGTSSTISITAEAKVATVIKTKNQYFTKYRYKELPNGTWSSISTVTNTTDANGKIIINTNIINLDINKSFEVELLVSDYFISKSLIYTVPSAKMLFSLRDGMVGVNKIPEAGKGAIQISGGINIDGIMGGSVPTGLVVPWSAYYSNMPSGWIACEGQAVSRSTYSKLYNVISTIYGNGNGSTTFNVPDLRGRVVAGFNSSNSKFNSVGEKGGAETHKLTIAEMPSHNHSGNTSSAGNHNHEMRGWRLTTNGGSYKVRSREDISGDGWDGANIGYAGNHYHSFSTSHSGSTGYHNNLQPYMAIVYIIKS